MGQRRSGRAWGLLLLLLGAFALRLFELGSQSLWWDEGISLHLATSTAADLLADRLDNIHPPLYFLLLKGWLALAGVSVFTARYFSVLASWLGVAALYAVARRRLARDTALLAAALGAISAVAVIYGQEVRVYALLPLIYLGLLGVTFELTRPQTPGAGRVGAWVLFAGLAWAGLHLHYIAAFAVAYVTVWALWVFVHGRRRSDLRALLLALAAVALASLPWFAAAVSNRAAVQGEASAGTFVTEAAPWPFLLGQVWGFHLTGLAGALGRQPLTWLLGGTAVVFLALLIYRLAQNETRNTTAALLAQWLLPLGSALLVWLVRSFSHPRYVAMFAPGLLLLAAYMALPRLGTRRPWSSLLGGLLAAGMVACSLVGLWLYFRDAGVAKDDVRGAALYLQEHAQAGDLILVPDTDWSLPFEYGGPATVAMPGWKGADAWAGLAEMTAGAGRVFVLDYPRGTRDWQGRLPFALQAAGTLVSTEQFAGVELREYALERPLAAPRMQPQKADFGSLLLTGAWIEQGAAAGGPLALALQWRAVAPGELERPEVALRLLGEDGWQLGTANDLLLDEDGRAAGQWAPGDVVTTYHLLGIPAGTPPLVHQIGMQLFEQDGGELQILELRDEQSAPQGQEALLGDVQIGRMVVGPALEESELPVPVSVEPLFQANGLTLLGATVPEGDIAPGQPLAVELLWQAEEELPDLRPEVRLVQEEREVAQDAELLNGRYPTTQWQPGELVWERRVLAAPPGSAGEAEIRLHLGAEQLTLGRVRIEAGARQTTRPEGFSAIDALFGGGARLAGYQVGQEIVEASAALPVSLLWQAEADGQAPGYTVFVHLLAPDGRIIAQHDGVPVLGERPTSGWAAGEYVVDLHELVFREPQYSGPARIAVGLYDAQSGSRLALASGQDQLVLPLDLQVGR